MSDEEKLSLSLEDTLKLIEEHIASMPDEEFAEKFLVDEDSLGNPWHSANQTSFYPCWYCGKDGNAHLCTDGGGRSFCPACRVKAEKEFLDWVNPKSRV